MRLRAVLPTLGLAGAALSLLPGRGTVEAKPEVTWRRQIAPIVYGNCTSCHHAGGSGPFSLTTYADAKRFASVMAEATTTRYMPPWLPVPGHGQFADMRRLSDEQISMVRAWAAAGAPEGSGPVPAAPVYTSEWALGPPDLVLEMAEPLAVPADGSDFFTNVVLPNPLQGTHWVRAMEIKPGTPQVVHHANVIVDRNASLRRAHSDWRKGIPGMGIDVDSGDAFDPDSHFLFWKPDSTALVEPKGMPWRLDEGNDLVLNLHLKPSGKPETTRARIGLYFTPEPATQHPMLLQLEHDSALDIPAGTASFPVEDTLRLPVAVEVLGVYPHAHYLGRRMEAWASLPDGTRRDLILIEDWDIDRQLVYRLAAPVTLPKDTELHMRFVYDNSAGNVHNPHTPPVRVRAGNRSEDEMAHLWLQVLPLPGPGMSDTEAQQRLEESWMQRLREKNPDDTIALYNLASLALSAGDAGRAEQLYGQLLPLRPDDARAHTGMGAALTAEGKDADAEGQFRTALRLDPENVDAGYDLAELDVKQGNAAEAEGLLGQIVSRHPDDLAARRLLTAVDRADGKPAEALEQMRAVVAKDGSAADWNDLGVMEARAGDRVAAEAAFRRALMLDPGLQAAAKNLQRLGR